MVSLNVALETARGRILVVDDDPFIGELLAVLFEQEGFEVQIAQDGCAGLLAFSEGHFNLIVTDFSMPRMTGLELAAAVRKTDPLVPIILVTGEANAIDAKAARQVGINRVIPKPFKLDELRKCVGLVRAKWPPAA
ncbi:acetoacetate metabolism regulatory protein AtoC [Candidatus Methylomirabilis lanthanidiphila]|uniref:Acetoacetate metabolism regulatory protein AtoC n=1 Tax=Candidatus Methylomirabilis lanthanidiphila TaxID=2211376 RepID=A0A564ZLL9_9BACT|nr:response regulator [Candidatus Methylomirabilis lanthanidiphila]VUZ85542.1 acetoacetate metabolism regulatory protein AtoC [Candidatus Methylomirabilis lanthanidiphila]